MKKELAIFNNLVEQLLKSEIDNPVVTPIPIDELYRTIDIELREEGAMDTDFVATLESLVLNTPKTASKKFFNQLFGGRNKTAILGELLSVMLNNSMYTYKVGGPQIGIEKEILKQVSTRVGYDLNQCGGTLAPGGSMTNLMGLLMARDWKDKEARNKGISKPLVIYTSIECHYSVKKNAAFAGIGRDHVRKISTDDFGAMDPVALEQAIRDDISNGLVPCMVNATAGTTVLAAFDPLQAIGELCKKHGLWLHVDGAYCGSVMFSERYKKHILGSELADSFTLNAHKMLMVPLSCSIIVVKDKNHLYDTFSNEASYLYQTSEDEYNPGKISMQCGRRNDALKFWSLWKSIGTSGLEKIVDHEFEIARQARDYVADHPDYTLYNSGDSVAVCFNYKNIDPKVLCNSLYEDGEMMVGYGKFREQEFVRLVTVNANNNFEDLLRFFKHIESYAERKSLV